VRGVGPSRSATATRSATWSATWSAMNEKTGLPQRGKCGILRSFWSTADQDRNGGLGARSTRCRPSPGLLDACGFSPPRLRR